MARNDEAARVNRRRLECLLGRLGIWSSAMPYSEIRPIDRSARLVHLGAAATARTEGRPLPWDDPAWQERIRRAKSCE